VLHCFVENNLFFVVIIALSVFAGVVVIVAVILLIIVIKQRTDNKRSYLFVVCFVVCYITLSPVRLSVHCLSVTFVRPTEPVEIFGNVSMPFGTLAVH